MNAAAGSLVPVKIDLLKARSDADCVEPVCLELELRRAPRPVIRSVFVAHLSRCLNASSASAMSAWALAPCHGGEWPALRLPCALG